MTVVKRAVSEVVPPGQGDPQPTGEGEPPYPAAFPGERRVYWYEGGEYGVVHQHDRPACAFRCFYPGGSSPCDEETAKRFIEWVKEAT